jgi:hypothetical protein
MERSIFSYSILKIPRAFYRRDPLTGVIDFANNVYLILIIIFNCVIIIF